MPPSDPSLLFGVKAFLGERDLADFKRAALLFDRLIAVELPMNRDTIACMSYGLIGQDVFVVGWPVIEESGELTLRPPHLAKTALRADEPDGTETSDILSRDLASDLLAIDEFRSVALVSSMHVTAGTTTNVLRAVLHQLPLPDANTPWQDISNWRCDTDARRLYARLRHWMNETARRDAKTSDVVDAIAAALADYETYMAAHHRMMHRTRAEVVLTTAVETFEDLATFKWSRAMTRLFGLFRAEATLTADELKAPGREIAYLSASRERFS
jgi:hypothetical protein